MGSKLFEPMSSQVPIVDANTGHPTPYFQRILQKISVSKDFAVTNGTVNLTGSFLKYAIVSTSPYTFMPLEADGVTPAPWMQFGDTTVGGSMTLQAGDASGPGAMSFQTTNGDNGWYIGGYNVSAGRILLDQWGSGTGWEFTTTPYVSGGVSGYKIFHEGNLSFGTGLTYNAGTGVLSCTVTGATTLATLTDVAISSPSNAQVLTYDSSTSKWKNAAASGGGGSTAIPLVPFPLEGIDTNTGSGVGVPAIVLAQYYCQQATPITGLWLPVVSVSVSGLLGYACVYDSGAITSGSASTYVGATKVAATTTAVSIPNTKQMLFIPFSASFTPTVGHIYYVGFSFYNATGTLNLAALAANKKEWFTSGTFNPPPSTLTTMTLSAGTNVGWFGG